MLDQQVWQIEENSTVKARRDKEAKSGPQKR